MTTDFRNHEFTTGADVGPEEDLIYWSSGITATSPQATFWLNRIQCYGKTQEEAQALRDRVLKGLEMVAEEERDIEMSQRATKRMVEQGLLVVGTAKIGSQVISAGLGSKGDD